MMVIMIIITTIICGGGPSVIIISCQKELLSHGQRLLKSYHIPLRHDRRAGSASVFQRDFIGSLVRYKNRLMCLRRVDVGCLGNGAPLSLP